MGSQSVSLLDNNLIISAYTYDWQSKKQLGFSQSINKESFTLNSDRNTILSAHRPNFVTSKESLKRAGFRLELLNQQYLSKDKSKVFTFNYGPLINKRNEELNFKVHDSNMQLLWESDWKFTEVKEEFRAELGAFEVTNDGSFYFIEKTRLASYSSSDKDKSPKDSYKLVTYSNKGQEKNNFSLKLVQKDFTYMSMNVVSNEELILTGLYANERTFWDQDGVFYIKIDLIDGSVKEEKYHEFDCEFIGQGRSDKARARLCKKEAAGVDYQLTNLRFVDAYFKEDGSFILIAEKRTSEATGYIAVVNLRSDGEVNWMRKIRKYQTIAGSAHLTNASSFFHIEVNNKHYFMFNDNRKNIEASNQEKITDAFITKGQSVIAIVALDENGNQSRKRLMKLQDTKVLMMPKLCQQVAENEVILFGKWKASHKFARIIFN